jgi:hypothetical protein
MIPVWKFYPEQSGAETQEVSPERWAWVALYSDCTILEQFGSDGRFHQLKEIDVTKLIGFQMVNLLGVQQPILIHWKPGWKLIHFYRNIRLHVGTPEEVAIRLYCFGYEANKQKVIIVIMPTDQIRIVEDVNEISIEG